IALVDQNKVVSALRGTEVVADATNLLALESSKRRKSSRFDNEAIHLCTLHRHVRAQAIPRGKGFTPHFKVFFPWWKFQKPITPIINIRGFHSTLFTMTRNTTLATVVLSTWDKSSPVTIRNGCL
ncbi:MAG TPA: hypothetical protein VK517_03810, partial [Cyclobacteriaceae bacterium]|nr:hypothetical protein [Cyclobacteriaceae bacterium]